MNAPRDCPFCGNDMTKVEADSFGLAHISCVLCGALGPQVLGEEAAITAWNFRADDRYTITPLGAAMLDEAGAGSAPSLPDHYCPMFADDKGGK